MNTHSLKSELTSTLDGFNPYNNLEFYYPFNFKPDDSQSSLLRLFKQGHKQAIQHYYYLVQIWLRGNINSPHLVMAVPGSKAGKTNSITKLTAALPLNLNLVEDATKAIKKIHSTKSFCKTNKRNTDLLKASLEIDHNIIKDKNILLLDDVTTTGQTFTTIEEMLLDAGAASVICLSLAKTAKLSNL